MASLVVDYLLAHIHLSPQAPYREGAGGSHAVGPPLPSSAFRRPRILGRVSRSRASVRVFHVAFTLASPCPAAAGPDAAESSGLPKPERLLVPTGGTRV